MTIHISPQPAPAGVFLTSRELADRWSCVLGTLAHWVKSKPGFPRPIRIGHRWLWRVDDVIAYEERLAGGAGRETA
jgi:hypothetical protein